MTPVLSPPDAPPLDAWKEFRLRLGELARSRSDGVRVAVPKHGHVYNPGRDPHGYFIVEGQVKLVVNAPNGKRCLLAVCTNGDVVGEFGPGGAERAETAVALRRTVIWRFAPARFLDALAANDMIEEYLAYKAAQVLHQQTVIVDMVTMESERRLAACLLGLCRLMGVRVGPLVHIDTRLTQEELSEMVGTTRSRVGHFLKGFRTAGMVRLTRRSTLLVDEQGLAEYLQGCGRTRPARGMGEAA